MSMGVRANMKDRAYPQVSRARHLSRSPFMKQKERFQIFEKRQNIA